MFPDGFVANLAVFVLGQLVAWGYLRTGLVVRGIVVLVLSWVLADAALVLRFGFSDTGTAYALSLAGMQALVAFEALRFGFGRWRRTRSDVVGRRAATFGEALRCYVRDELDEAIVGFLRLVRRDPWDLPAKVALGAAFARSGRIRDAQRQLVGARRLDREGRYRDAIDYELERLRIERG